MRALIAVLAVVFVIRYWDTETGKFLAATVLYQIGEDCEQHKARVDLQPDPPGTRTAVDCVDETRLPGLLRPDAQT